MPYIELDGLRTYYEAHGQGEPLLMLHGGTVSIESFAPQTPEFARRCRVLLPERRGHGRTPDPGPIGYDLMTQDTIAFLGALAVPAADVLGWSDGGIVALHLALARPELVRKLVLVGVNYRPEGLATWFTDWVRRVTAETFPVAVRREYERLSPDGPGHFTAVWEKLRRLWLEEPRLSPNDLSRITAPTLVLAGDRDIMTLEHTFSLAASIPGARLCVLPAGHDLLRERADLANRIILEFLQG